MYPFRAAVPIRLVGAVPVRQWRIRCSPPAPSPHKFGPGTLPAWAQNAVLDAQNGVYGAIDGGSKLHRFQRL